MKASASSLIARIRGAAYLPSVDDVSGCEFIFGTALMFESGSVLDAGGNMGFWVFAIWLYTHQDDCPLPNLRRFAPKPLDRWLGIEHATTWAADGAGLFPSRHGAVVEGSQ